MSKEFKQNILRNGKNTSKFKLVLLCWLQLKKLRKKKYIFFSFSYLKGNKQPNDTLKHLPKPENNVCLFFSLNKKFTYKN